MAAYLPSPLSRVMTHMIVISLAKVGTQILLRSRLHLGGVLAVDHEPRHRRLRRREVERPMGMVEQQSISFRAVDALTQCVPVDVAALGALQRRNAN